MKYETIEFQVESSVAIISINRPPFNPLNSTFFIELSKCLDTINADNSIRSVVLTGVGDRAFAAGADVQEMTGLDRKGIQWMGSLARTAFEKIEKLSKPVLAAVNGLALGGGCELALACDLRISSEKAKFALPELNLGIIPGAGGTQRLQRIIGQARAKEMIFLGDMVPAEKALEYGLVNKVVGHEELNQTAMEWALRLADKAPIAMHMAKTAMNSGGNVDIQTALDIESVCSDTAFISEDRKEGMAAFAEKRKPNFSGH